MIYVNTIIKNRVSENISKVAGIPDEAYEDLLHSRRQDHD